MLAEPEKRLWPKSLMLAKNRFHPALFGRILKAAPSKAGQTSAFFGLVPANIAPQHISPTQPMIAPLFSYVF